MQLPASIAGIEITEDAVRVAVVRTGGRSPRVVELVAADVSGTGPEVAAMAVREALSRLKSRPAAHVLSVPASLSVLRLLQVPFRATRKIAAAVPFELEPMLAFPIDELVVNHLVARSLEGQTEVLAIGVRRQTLSRQVEALRAAGVTVDGAYLDALSLTSLWAGRRKRDSAARAVLHFRPREALLGVVEGGRLTYLRRLDFDPVAFRASPAVVALEVRNLLRAYAAERGAGEAPAGLSVSGAPLHEAGRTIFEAELDIPVRYDSLADVSSFPGIADESLRDEFNCWSAPVAAAYSAAGGPFALNFLREGPRERGFARAALATCVMGAAAIVAYLGLVFLDYRKDNGSLRAMGDAIWREFEATYPELAQARPANDPAGVKALEALQTAALEEIEQSQGVSLERFSAPPLLDMLMEISAAFGPEVAEIEKIDLQKVRDGREITIEGIVRDSAKYNAAIDALDKSLLFEVDRTRSRRTSGSGKDTFALKAKVG